jgi:hypothetical protein
VGKGLTPIKPIRDERQNNPGFRGETQIKRDIEWSDSAGMIGTTKRAVLVNEIGWLECADAGFYIDR